MADVPDHLVPTDGLTSANIRYTGFDCLEGDEVTHRFELTDEDKNHVGTFYISLNRWDGGSVDGQIAVAHKQMSDVLRQWLFVTDSMREHYEQSVACRSG